MDWDATWESARFAPPDSPDGGVIIYNWMTKIGMSPTTRNIYALIYQYSADGAGYYTGGAAYAARRCGVSEKTAWRAIRDLLSAGLVRETVPHVRGDSRSCASLQAVIGRVGEFRSKWLDHSPETALPAPFPVGAPMDKMSIGAQPPMDKMSVGAPAPMDKMSVGAPTPMDKMSIGAPTPMDKMSIGAQPPMDKMSVGESRPMDKMSVGAPTPMDKMSIGAQPPMDKMSVGETEESAGGCASMDILSSDQWTECPLEAHKDNKDIDIYPILPSYPSIPEVDLPVAGPGEDLMLAEARLAASAVNRRSLGEIHEPLSALIALGFTAEEVQAAWDRRQDDARQTVSGDRFMPNLSKWLADRSPQGAWSMLYAARASAPAGDSALATDAPELELCVFASPTGDVWGCRPVDGGSGRILLDESGRAIVRGRPGSKEIALRALAELSEKIA